MDRRTQASIEQAAEHLNDKVRRVVEAFGLRPFVLREEQCFFQLMSSEVGETKYSYLHKPYGLQLTPIGYWTESVTIYFESPMQKSIPTAEVRWSSGGGAAHADLIARASQAADALNLAFGEFDRKYIVKED